jgi:pimeloyl-ACP methyl ester carboxylesterase
MEPIADATMGRWFTPAFAGSAAFRERFVNTPPEGYAACCDALRDWDFRAELGKVSAPTLILVGADDPATSPDEAGLLAAGIPDARVTVIPDAAHLLNVEQAEAFNAAVLVHLTGGEQT